MDDLNIQTKEDSAEKLAAVEGLPTKYFLFSGEINAIKIYINNLKNYVINTIQSSLPPTSNDVLLNIGALVIGSNSITVPLGANWKINGFNYSNPTALNFAVIATTSGKVRTDILVANETNGFDLIQGTETTSIAVTPTKPANTILITQIQVNDSGIDDVADPNTGVDFVLKAESIPVNVGFLGDEALILNSNSSNLNVVEHGGEFNSLQMTSEFLRKGKVFNIKNGSTTPFEIMHLGVNGNIQFTFPDSLDFNLQPKEIVQFLYNQVPGQSPKLEFIGRIIADNSLNPIDKPNIVDGDKVISINGTTGGFVSTAWSLVWSTFFKAKTDALYKVIESTTTTGTAVKFDFERQYGTDATPVSGNITFDSTGAKIGVSQMMIHNSGTAPTFGSQFVKLNVSKDYVISVKNTIAFYYDGAKVKYIISQNA